MATIVDGTAGINTPVEVEIQGATSGSIAIVAPAVAGTNTQTLVAATGTLTPKVLGSVVASTSGTSVSFTNIPSWSKTITLLFRNVSTSGITNYQIQLGSSAGFVTTGYNGASMRAVATATLVTADTTGFKLQSILATATSNGLVTFSTYDNLTWYGSGNVSDNTNGVMFTFGGAVTLPGVLDRIRITTINGTDVFDGGTISTMFE